MNEHVAFGMKFRRLLDSLHDGDLRQHMLRGARFHPASEMPCAPALRSTCESVRRALARAETTSNLLRGFLNRREGCGLDGIFKARRKAYRPQQSQFIFGKSLLRISDRADDSASQVLPSTDIVEHFAADRVQKHAVDGEIAACNVFSRIIAESHFIWVAAVGISDVAAERSHLDALRPGGPSNFAIWHCFEVGHGHEHNSKLRSHRISLRKDAHDLRGRGIGGDVVILGFSSQQEIAHAPAHQIGLKAALAQSLYD